MTSKISMVGAAILGLATVVGCNGTVTGVGGSGGSGGTGGTGGVGGTGGTGGGECASFADQPGTASVTVRFRNDTGQPVYLPTQCGGGIDYTIDLPGGADAPVYVFDHSCLQTCAALQTEPQYECGVCQPTVFRLDPGATHDVVWDGTGLFFQWSMPAECWEQPSSNLSCQQIVTAAPALYDVSAIGHSSCDGPCTCDAQGLCFGSPSGQVAQSDPQTIYFPEEALVEVIFNVCAFGCAD